MNPIARLANAAYFRYLVWRDAAVARLYAHRALAAGSTHHQQPTPTRLEQSLRLWQQAQIDIDAGRVQTAADMLDAAVTQSGWIYGIVDTIAQGIPGLPHKFVGPPELVRALQGIEGERRGIYGELFPEAEKAKMLLFGAGLGVCPMQRLPVAEAPDHRWGEPRATFRLFAWHPRHLRYDHAQARWALMTWGGEIWIDEHPEEFCLFTPYGALKPWEIAPWKFTVKAFLMGRDAEFDRVRHSAMNGPVWWFQGGPETTPQNLADASEKVMAKMERRARITVQHGESINVTAPPAGDLSAVYREILQDAKDEVAVGWLGNNVVTQSKEGGLGSCKDVYERMTARRIDFIAAALERFEQKHVLDVWAPQQEPGARVGILYDTRPPSERAAPPRAGDPAIKNVTPIKPQPGVAA